MEIVPRSQSHLAELLGISKGFASKLAARGMPTHSLEAAQDWRKANLNPRISADQNRKPRQPERIQPAGMDYMEAKTAREVYMAEMTKLDLEERQGSLISVAAVGKAWAVALATARDALLQIPSRMGPVLAAEKDPQIIEGKLHEEIHRTMTTLAAMLARTHAAG